jgi:hypothetical protein
MFISQIWFGMDLWYAPTVHFSRLAGGNMKKIAGLLFIIFILAAASCDVEHDLSDESVIFYNFSSLAITELTVSDFDTLNIAYVYNNDIPPAEYHIFELPKGVYIFKIKTEDGVFYEHQEIHHYALLPTDVIFSADYEIRIYR